MTPRPRLSDATASEGYQLVIDPQPWTRPDIAGNPPDPRCFNALLCAGNVIACTADNWDHAYHVAHEIAEARHGHTHSERVWEEQANILAKWLRAVAA